MRVATLVLIVVLVKETTLIIYLGKLKKLRKCHTLKVLLMVLYLLSKINNNNVPKNYFNYLIKISLLKL